MSTVEATGLGFFAPTPHAARPPPARFTHQILLVEEDRAIREAGAAMLVRAGYSRTP
jgi:hypothetical protein